MSLDNSISNKWQTFLVQFLFIFFLKILSFGPNVILMIFHTGVVYHMNRHLTTKGCLNFRQSVFTEL